MSRTLLAVSGLTHGLAHQLRGSLSVIQNELIYLRSRLPAGECDRALERCRGMANQLREITQIGRPSLSTLEITLEDLVSITASALAVSPPRTRAPKEFVSIDRVRWMIGIKSLAKIGTRFFSGRGASIASHVSRGDLVLRIGLGFLKDKLPCERSAASLTEFFNLDLDADNVDAPIADSVLWAHNAEIAVASDAREGVSVTINLPRSR